MAEKDKKKNVWSWKIDEFELKNQIESYDNLKITESYRGISVLIISALLVLSLLLSLLGVYSSVEDIVYGLIIYIPVIFFVYKGHRWAIISLLALWTLEKIYQFYEAGGVWPIIWWLIVTPYFWKALKVENKKKDLIQGEEGGPGGSFCHSCGGLLTTDSKFCSNCGTKTNYP